MDIPARASRRARCPIPPLIDTHCHLDDPRLAPELEAVLVRMHEAGVAVAVTVGTDPDSCRWSAELAATRPDVFASVGYHPTEAGTPRSEADWEALAALARQARVVAVGETGLDWHGDRAPRDAQRSHFSRHLALARAADRPVVIHCRDAYADCLDQLHAEWPPPVRGVMHCFSGTTDHAKAALDLGLHLSFAGPVGYPGSHALRAVARTAPADRILVETDAPWLPPQSRRGRRNEPAFVAETAAALAAARGMSVPDLAEATTRNTLRLFRMPDLP